MPSIEVVLDACKGFVVVGKLSGKVELFHHTLVEYLSTSSQLLNFAPEIPQNCLIYLLYEDFAQTCHDINNGQFKYPFSAYASVFWAEHVRSEP